jgi:hypothetical protein
MKWGRHFDHAAVVCSVHAKFKTSPRSISPYDVSLLQEESCLVNYQNDLSVRFSQEPISHQSSSIDEQWLVLRNSVLSAAASQLKPASRSSSTKYYMSAVTKSLVEERSRLYQSNESMQTLTPQMKQEWSRRISRSLRNDWRNHVAEVVSKIEDADRVGDQREVHRLSKQLAGKANRPSINVSKDEQGIALASEADRLNVWFRYFSEKFKAGPEQRVDPILITPNVSFAVDEGPLRESEILFFMLSMKSRKSPGADGIQIELIRSSSDATTAFINLCKRVWEEEKFPEQWHEGQFVCLFKKGCKDDPNNYRALCMLSHAYKVISSVILNRIRLSIESRLLPGQEGFRGGRSCSDNLFSFRTVVQHCVKNKINAEAIFIDFVQAFDFGYHHFLSTSLVEHGVGVKFRRLISLIYGNAVGVVKGTAGELSKPFNVRRGVVQGDPLSPVLFLAMLNSVWIRSLNENDGVQIHDGWRLESLKFADDATYLSTSASASQDKLNRVAAEGEKAGLSINCKKTVRMILRPKMRVPKTTETDVSERKKSSDVDCDRCGRLFPNLRGMHIHRSRWCTGDPSSRSRAGQKMDRRVKAEKREIIAAAEPMITCQGNVINNVYSTRYLGSVEISHGGSTEEIESRIHKATVIFHDLHRIWPDSRLAVSVKMRLFQSRVISSLTYGCESWSISSQDAQKSTTFTVSCSAKMIGVYNDEFVRAIVAGGEEAKAAVLQARRLSIAAAPKVMDFINFRRWCWIGHVARMSEDRNPRKSLDLLDHADNGPLSLLETRQQLNVAADRKEWLKLFDDVKN